ncbi:hypothetical protein [Planktothrix sp. FACHB-1365]|uniref:hypothetical protein n=1 Tax=Planktothrix sp. FACHB-1365 TaxID=2692855 RepID=UPI001688E1FB|nr:hypothetical protein [Planktothrix sp. FACHB-1365]MBD2481769.1 hypothetical protein [Planktothrix sp. FACHB-1365]
MSLNPEGLQKHCETILQSRRIKNKIVILCEGDIPKLEGRSSPQSYSKIEKMPDANFYKACVPQGWSQYRPQFFNCGDRQDVINSYFSLLDLHQQDPSKSYLEPTKLFAIVDLDLQSKEIGHNYQFPDTETIFYDLYQGLKVNQQTAPQHRIWVTGLIHKESYFIIPELQETFDSCFMLPVPLYKGNNLLLTDIYKDMAELINQDPDLKNHLITACQRINYCQSLNCTDVNQLKISWIQEFNSTVDVTRKNELIYVLLTLIKAKNFWREIEPPPNWSGSADNYKEQLLLKIGKFYSEHSDAEYHLSVFFKILYQYQD